MCWMADDVTLRAPVAADAAAIARVLCAHAASYGGEAAESAAVVEHWFTLPGFDIEADFRVATVGREMVGYADVAVTSGVGWVDVRAVPEAPPEALAALVAFGEQRAAERLPGGSVCRSGARPAETAMIELLRERGYAHVRSSYTMQRELGDGDRAFAWPTRLAELLLTVPGEDDLPAIHVAHEESFARHWEFQRRPYAEWREWNLGPEAEIGLWRVARDGATGEIAGFVIASRGRGEGQDIGWVDVLGVRVPWRRRGLGEALLRTAFACLREAGQARVGLGVDAGTTGAVSLYERVGMDVTSRLDMWDRPL
jgi:ribosomal protein S18 acetylase RimI-like enzyme